MSAGPPSLPFSHRPAVVGQTAALLTPAVATRCADRRPSRPPPPSIPPPNASRTGHRLAGCRTSLPTFGLGTVQPADGASAASTTPQQQQQQQQQRSPQQQAHAVSGEPGAFAAAVREAAAADGGTACDSDGCADGRPRHVPQQRRRVHQHAPRRPDAARIASAAPTCPLATASSSGVRPERSRRPTRPAQEGREKRWTMIGT